jgi:hypothetical protein
MTTPTIHKIGLVAHPSPQGDWAFDTALRIARTRTATLNVFEFLESPFDVPLDRSPTEVAVRQFEAWELIAADRVLRERYEDRLGDFVEVGFRVCGSARHNLELRQCLRRKEYQLLIIPYLDSGASFGNMPIQEFAFRFPAPILLVGPEHDRQYHLNPPAEAIDASADLGLGECLSVREPGEYQNLSVI